MLGTNSVLCGQSVMTSSDGHAQQMSETCGRHGLRLPLKHGKVSVGHQHKDAERTLVWISGQPRRVVGTQESIHNSRLLHEPDYLFGVADGGDRLGGDGCCQRYGGADFMDVADPFVINTVKEAMWKTLSDFADLAFLNEEEAFAQLEEEAEALVRWPTRAHCRKPARRALWF